MTDAQTSTPSPTTAEKAALLASLHVPGDPLIVVNVWDAITARIVARTSPTAHREAETAKAHRG